MELPCGLKPKYQKLLRGFKTHFRKALGGGGSTSLRAEVRAEHLAYQLKLLNGNRSE